MRNSRSEDLAQTVVLQKPRMPLSVIIRSNSRMEHYHIFASLIKKSEKQNPMPAISNMWISQTPPSAFAQPENAATGY